MWTWGRRNLTIISWWWRDSKVSVSMQGSEEIVLLGCAYWWLPRPLSQCWWGQPPGLHLLVLRRPYWCWESRQAIYMQDIYLYVSNLPNIPLLIGIYIFVYRFFWFLLEKACNKEKQREFSEINLVHLLFLVNENHN